jgi:hypothetical protein
MSGPADPATRARSLARLFAGTADHDFAMLEPVAATDVPEPFRTLLDHRSHMTVAMERFHGDAVELRVIAEANLADGRYGREILLVVPGTAGGAPRVVQHGIVRIDLGAVDAVTARRIRRHEEPLGRILLAAGVLCEVQDVALLRIVPGPHLRERAVGRETYGRVASITVAGRPAIELLEIVAS